MPAMRCLHKIFLLFILFVGFSAKIFAQAPFYVPLANLQAWYSLDSSAYDSSGNGNNGTVVSCSPVPDRFGRSNGAYKFDGSSSYIFIPSSTSLNIKGSVSLTVWLKSPFPSATGQHQILFRGDERSSLDPYFLAQNGSSIIFQRDVGTGTTVNSVSFPVSSIDSGHFHMIVGTFDSTSDSMRIYLDGVEQQVAYKPGIISYYTDSAHNMIGAVDYGTDQFFSGTIDDAGIWSRALSPCEIYQLYKASTDPQGIITGDSTICIGSPTELFDTAAGGIWSSANTSIATVNSSTGIVAGVNSGATVITYTVGNACYTTFNVTVDPSPLVRPISGVSIVCPGNTNNLSDASSGGVWSSTNASVAVINSGGVLSGVSVGNATISYTITNSFGCSTAARMQVVVGDPIITTIAGTGAVGYTGDGLAATSATLHQPHGIATDASGNIYVADYGNNVIRKISTAGVITTFAGNGTTTYGGEGVAATATGFNGPYTVLVDQSSGNVYVSDAYNNRVRKITTAGLVYTIVGNGTAGFSGDGGPSGAATCEVNTPAGMAFDASGNLYIGDLHNNRVRKVNTSGIISTVAGNGTAGYVGDGVLATTTELNVPNYVHIDQFGNLIISDNGNHRIRMVNTAGYISTIAGTGTAGYGGLDGHPATVAELSYPGGITFDGAGNLYIADYGNNRVRIVNNGTDTIQTFAGTGTSGYSGDGGPATAAKIYNAVDVAFDPQGNLLIADFNNNVIRKVAPIAPHLPSVTGTNMLCVGGSTTLADSLTGGTWTSSNSSVASVGTSGMVFGSTSGTAVISYTEQFYCGPQSTAFPVTVNTIPSITGSATVCSGTNDTLSDADAGGTWTSSNVLVGTINPTSGVLTGIGVGTTDIAYTDLSGCYTVLTVTVVGSPAAISPSSAVVCVGSSVVLTDATSGGTWSSSNSNASVSGGTVVGSTAGGVTISYSLSSTCYSIAPVTVNAKPSDISPATPVAVCVGSSTVLTDATSGGTWSSSGSAASVSGGTVTGVSVGVVNISYTGPDGCAVGKPVTVNTQPAAISPGSGVVCAGSTLVLTDGTGGGVWQSSNSDAGVVNGTVTGVTAGSVTISYSIGACYSLAPVTVNSTPVAISPGTPVSVCVGTNTTLTDGTSGGTWSSSGSAASVIGGTVTGVSTGIVNISYTGSNGCYVLKPVTVNSAPVAISPGSGSVCVGSTLTLTDGTSGGTWASSNTNAGVVNGTVTGLTAGTATISYSIGSCYSLAPVTVNGLPSAISPGTPVSVCVGTSTTLTDATGGGTWSSSGSAASVSGGTVTGVSTGTVNISYTGSNGCYVLKPVTVNSAPGGISPGSGSVCVGSTLTLTDGTSGGTWASSNTNAGVVNGTVTGLTAGTATISYSVGSCYALAPVTVNGLPSAIGPGTAVSICLGSSTGLTESGGGTWSSSNTGVATVGSSGTVNGVGTGTANISFTNSSGCYVLKPVTVNSAPVAIIPSSVNVCVGSSTTLSDATAGGTWASSNTNAGVVNGTVTGLTAGTATISYSIGSCYSLASVTVNAVPGAISPGTPLSVCIGTTTSLTGTGGGVWSTSNASLATVGSTGVVTGVSAGVVTISYTNGSGCYVTKAVTVIVTPGSILPSPATVCTGNSVTLTETTGGGTWVSGSTGVATIGSTGVGTVSVNGVSAGTSVISYQVGTCYAVTTLTVNASPSGITPSGGTSLCSGGSVTLVDGTPGGTWSSGSTGVATVGTGGAVHGVSGGVAQISYTVLGCSATKAVSVNVAPSGGTVTGAGNVCSGTTSPYADTASGGVWSMSNTHATINSATGLLTGVSPGVDTIKYTITNSCGTATATKTVTVGVFLTAGTITGSGSSVCVGSRLVLSDLAPGGVWSESTGAASVVGGTVTGVVAGPDTISYTVTGSCGTASATYPVTVNGVPVAGTISGAASLCSGMSSPYTESAGGGTWSVSNTTIATISSGGVLTTTGTGTETIIYTQTNSCGMSTATLSVTIGAALTAGTISGGSAVCTGATDPLSDGTIGGVWSVSNATATISGTGVLTGVSTGIDTAIYTVSNSCGTASATYAVSVNGLPSSGTVSGPGILCTGGTGTYTDGAGGGVWSMSNGHATIVSGTGVATPVSVGVDTVSYTVTGSCGTAVSTMTVSVGTGVSAGTISGTPSVCTGGSDPLSDGAIGGVWSSGSTGVATVSAGGIVTGVSAGTAVISYTVSGGSCGTAIATYTVSVSTAATAGTVSGPVTLCLGGGTGTYTDGAGGGVWSMSNGHATVSSGGVVTPVSMGTDTIYYTVAGSGACGSAVASEVITIGSSGVTVAPISGATGVCVGSPVTLGDVTSGGVWSMSNGHASIGSTGMVTGISAGVDTVSYTVGSSCGTATATSVITVSTGTGAGTIVGPASVCAGTYTLFTDTTGGGVWSMSNGLATITGSGVVSALTDGTDTVVYTVVNACGTGVVRKPLTISGLLSAGVISGPSTLCMGGPVGYSDGGATGAGVWSSSNTAVAVIGTDGTATGVSTGTATLSYTVTTSCGTATAVKAVTVSVLSGTGVISGGGSLCTGSLESLTESVGGGAWGSSNGSATVTTGGVLTGITPGVDTITYTVSGVCGSAAATLTVTVSALTLPGGISGGSAVCAGSTLSLSNSAGGGVWTTSDAGVATIGSTSGVLTGVSAGSAMVTYTISNGCGTHDTTLMVTVNSLPDAGIIGGADSVCVGSTVTLTESVGGGVWSAGNGNATVDGSGDVTGVSTGTDPISYTVSNGCGTAVAVDVLEVSPMAVAATISGSSSVCVGSGITLTASVGGGSWYCSNGNAYVAGPGIIDGVTVGVDTVFYTESGGCGTIVSSKILNVNPDPVVSVITGGTSQCVGSTLVLGDATGGGVWTSSTGSVATVGVSSGTVTGVSAGVSTLTYTVTNLYGCPTSVTHNDTVLVAPVVPGITGVDNVCIGSSLPLSDSMSGGVWTSGSTGIAMIGAGTGVVSGVSAGSAMITYTVSNMCGTGMTMRSQLVSPAPVVSAVSGSTHECVGGSGVVSDATVGGVWSSGNTAVATVDASGNVTGVAAGSTDIDYTYTGTSGCSVTLYLPDTVYAGPVVAAIGGSAVVCAGSTATLTDGTGGGVWSSSAPGVALVSSGGVVSGVSAGSAVITYTVSGAGGCTGMSEVTEDVLSGPAVSGITGATHQCVGSLLSLSDGTGGGVWSSSDNTVAVAGTGGVVSGVSAGVVSVIYSVTDGITGCTTEVEHMDTVGAVPLLPAIGGSGVMCSGASVTLSDDSTGGVWTSGAAGVATIGSSSGVLTGVSAGTAALTYTYTSLAGCVAMAVAEETVNASPAVAGIGGVTEQCVGGGTSLSDATAGGVWSSSDGSVATVDGSGTVSGVSAGMVTISYTVSGLLGCSGTATIADTVSVPLTAAVLSGDTDVCAGSETILSGSVAGGVWSSSASGVAFVSGTGVVDGVSMGSAEIYYVQSNACGSVTDSVGVNVHGLPSAGIISGPGSVCAGSTVTLDETVSGGVWSSSDVTVATVSGGGVVSGVSGGVVTISYTQTDGYGCAGLAEQTETVGGAIGSIVVTPTSATLCHGHSVLLEALGGSGALSYQWNEGGTVLSGAIGSTLEVTTPGVYGVTVSSGGCSESVGGVTVSAPPVAVISAVGGDLTTGSYASYQWYRNGVAIAGGTTRTIAESGAGRYTVVVSDGNGCTDTSAVYVVSGGGGTNGVSVVGGSSAQIRLYPNPATEVVHVEADVEVQTRVLSVDGREVRSLQAGKDVPVGGLVPGVYVIQVYDLSGVLLANARVTRE
jgi:Concanavalin A-like lectin/glucanases superfamily/Bacterial Ig-like domain (group 2)/NHL repeat